MKFGCHASTYRPGDIVWRWWDSGAFGSEPQILTVVRVNAVTVTVRTEQGTVGRVKPSEIEGRWS